MGIDLHELSDYALEISKADQTEVFSIKATMRNYYIDDGVVTIGTDNTWVGVGVKSIIKKKIGYFSKTIHKKREVEGIVEKSLEIAKTSPSDEKFTSLPSPEKISGNVEGVYDENTAQADPGEIVENLVTFLESAQREGVKVMNGFLRISVFEFVVKNSLGVDFSHKGTLVYLFATAKKEMGEGIIKRFSTSLKGINYQEAGEDLFERTKLASSARAFKGVKEVDAIIAPMEAAGILSVIPTAASGELINRRASPWINKLGQEIASKDLTVIDDGRLPGGLRSALADDEGVPTTKKPIIESGILKNYLFDTYNAGIAGTKSTGNGFRRGVTSIEDAHTRPVSCEASNVIIQAGNKDLQDLISETDEGVLIYKFAYPQVDPISGNFGLEVRNAVLIENGSAETAIKHAILAGNIYTALRNISGLGKQQYFIENFLVPYIRFSKLQLVGL
ncbi:MAG: TldD/PmbA family protein [Candidatus Njordarchaeales archaeon]